MSNKPNPNRPTEPRVLNAIARLKTELANAKACEEGLRAQLRVLQNGWEEQDAEYHFGDKDIAQLNAAIDAARWLRGCEDAMLLAWSATQTASTPPKEDRPEDEHEDIRGKLQRATEALREFERAHRIWMNTPVHTPAGEKAYADKEEARRAYIAATKAAHPTWIVM